MSGFLHVVVAAIFNPQGELLLSKRAAHQHQGGLWEFPGGKKELGESVEQALIRELQEELGITATRFRPLITIKHRYPDKSVLLDVWRVDGFDGEPLGREGQPLCWVPRARLGDYQFPAANRAIVQAVQLPERYLITPEPLGDRAAFLQHLKTRLQSAEIELLQLRAKQLGQADYLALAAEVLPLCRVAGVKLLLNGGPELLDSVDAAGVQLTQALAAQYTSRPLAADKLLGISCHDPLSIEHAGRLQADFALLSPVQSTACHPEAMPLGWEQFANWVADALLPVYALGGVAPADLMQAQLYGGQGIAAIRSLWGGE